MSESATQAAPDGIDRVAAPGKKFKRVRKTAGTRSESTASSSGTSSTVPPAMNTAKRGHLLRSPLYIAFLLLRLVMIATPGQMEASEHTDGVDYLASAILPNMAQDSAIRTLPKGMFSEDKLNLTRSIVGAAFSSGIPYASVAIACKKAPALCPSPANIGMVAVYLPRVWMFVLSLITDALLFRTFAVYESEHAVSAVVMYASTWTTIVGATRNTNFALEAMCLTAILAGVFGWPIGQPRPLFWLSGAALALATFLRPINFMFILTPLIYLSSLWGKNNVSLTRYIMAAMEGIAIFAALATVFVSVDSLFYGHFTLRSGNAVIENFDSFLEAIFAGEKLSYKGSLVYTPINAAKESLTRKYIRSIAHNTTPGQMFLSLPGILGPLFIVLMRESYKGMLVAMKELMSEVKAAANTKKGKKKKGKKNAAAKEREEELMVFFDTVQTTFLLGLLMEVMQNNDRLGIISLMALIPPAIMCMPGTIFGEKSSKRFRMLHGVFTFGMVLFFGVLNQGGVQRMMLDLGAGGVSAVPENSHVVLYKGAVGHRSALGPNVKNVTIHDGGDSRLKLMTVLRSLKELPEYHEDRLLVAAAGTVDMKDDEFKKVAKVASLHMSTINMPQNVDEMLKKSDMSLYKFIGDEDESIIKDMEDEAEQEEAEKEEL